MIWSVSLLASPLGCGGGVEDEGVAGVAQAAVDLLGPAAAHRPSLLDVLHGAVGAGRPWWWGGGE